MWVRKQIEISPKDIVWGALQCARQIDRDETETQVHQAWGTGDSFVCLSIRSGFDLLLKAAGWPAGSEIIMSGLTIPDMPRIVRKNGLVPIGVDLELSTLCPSAHSIEAAITARTQAIVIAHLFGGRADLRSIMEVAARHNLTVIEDCAQGFIGSHYRGDPQSDVSMFSFGPIKTNSALGGAVFCVRNPELLARLNSIHANWPLQSRRAYFRRLVKYAIVKLISTRMIASCIQKSLRLFGRNHDKLASKMARGFAGPHFFRRIRQRPSLPLLLMMHKKLTGFDQRCVSLRAARGQRLAQRLGNSVHVLAAERPTYWVFTVLVDQPQRLVERLWAAGFDATTSCSLQPVTTFAGDPGDSAKHSVANSDRNAPDMPVVNTIMRHIVFLPFDIQMPTVSLQKLCDTILAAKAQPPALPEGDVRTVAEMTV